MSKYIPRVKHEIEFQGDTITMNMQRLSRSDVMSLAPHFSTMATSGEGEDAEPTDLKLSFETQLEVNNLAAEWLPKYIHDFNGLYDSEKTPIPLSTVIEDSYFIALMNNIIHQLFKISMAQKEEKEEVKKLPQDTSETPQ